MRADINVAMAVWVVVVVGSARSRAVVRSTARAMRWGAGVGAGVGAPGGGWRGAARGARAGRRVGLGRDREGCGGWASGAT
jgi:hypothetical protein